MKEGAEDFIVNLLNDWTWNVWKISLRWWWCSCSCKGIKQIFLASIFMHIKCLIKCVNGFVLFVLIVTAVDGGRRALQFLGLDDEEKSYVGFDVSEINLLLYKLNLSWLIYNKLIFSFVGLGFFFPGFEGGSDNHLTFFIG